MGRQRTEEHKHLPKRMYREGDGWRIHDPVSGKKRYYSESKYSEEEVANLARQLESSAIAHRVAGAPMAMQSRAQILASALDTQNAPGIYVLLNGEEILYVGQSVNVIKRIYEHTISRSSFNRFHFIPCPKDKLDAMERAYISALSPRLNQIAS